MAEEFCKCKKSDPYPIDEENPKTGYFCLTCKLTILQKVTKTDLETKAVELKDLTHKPFFLEYEKEGIALYHGFQYQDTIIRTKSKKEMAFVLTALINFASLK